MTIAHLLYNSATNDGGAIENRAGALTVQSCSFTQNTLGRYTTTLGAVHNLGDLATATFVDSFFTDNLRGGIYNEAGHIEVIRTEFSGNLDVNIYSAGGDIELISSTIVDNHSSGIHCYDCNLTLERSTVSRNLSRGILVFGGVTRIAESTIAGNGGGISSRDGSLSVVNSTISGNSTSASGGGVYCVNTTLRVDHSTITDNTADADGDGMGRGGGFYVLDSFALLTNSIVSGNRRFDAETVINNDITGAIDPASSYNITGYDYGTGLVNGVNGNIVDVDPQLGPLADNGGPTMTHTLLPGSPAIDAADPDSATDKDQRGILRPILFDTALRSDIGALELVSALIVDENSDVDDGNYLDGHLSLREAIKLSNELPAFLTIHFDASLSGSTITLEGTELALTDNVTIIGLGQDQLTIDANGLSRIFRIDNGINATISSLTLAGGYARGPNEMDKRGGAIYCDGILTLESISLLSNTADAEGGGLYLSGGSTSITNVLVQDNFARGAGGGIYNQASTLTIQGSVFEQNDGSWQGGGLCNASGGTSVTVVNTIFSSNAAAHGAGIDNSGILMVDSCHVIDHDIRPRGPYGSYGGGIRNTGTLSLTESLVSRNWSTGYGGGINNNGGVVTVVSSTISHNQAVSTGRGGGIYNIDGNVSVTATTLAGNSAEEGGGIYNASHAVLTVDSCTLIRNIASRWGGGIANISETADATLLSTKVDQSHSAYGGGIYISQGHFHLVDSAVSSSKVTQNGAGIVNHEGTLVVESSLVSNNSAEFSIGGIHNQGKQATTRVSDSTISGNYGDLYCGGIYNDDGDVLLYSSEVRANTSRYAGGGLINDGGRLQIESSTISGNIAGGEGAGISNQDGSLRILTSTISGNKASGSGGGIYNREGSAEIEHCTITNNVAGSNGNGSVRGGGLFDRTTNTLLTDSIVAGNYRLDGETVISNDITGILAPDSHHNLTGYDFGTGLVDGVNDNIVGVDPLLGPLADNGGSTPTHALLLDSPAINAGTPSLQINYDQRGIERDIFQDIGAFEFTQGARITYDDYGNGLITISGTEGDDEIFLKTEGLATVTINGRRLSFPEQVQSTVRFNIDGDTGIDQVHIHGSSGYDEFFSQDGDCELTSEKVGRIRVTNAESVDVYSNGGNDTATLYGTDGDDTYNGTANDARMFDGSGLRVVVHGFSEVEGIVIGFGFDTALFYDSPGDDTFISDPNNYSASKRSVSFSGPGFYHKTQGFDQSIAYAMYGGIDTAQFMDSKYNDLFVASPDRARMEGVGFHSSAYGFEKNLGFALNGGVDAAYLHDGAGDDMLVAHPQYVRMTGDGYYNAAQNFETVTGFALNGGTDQAFLHDSTGDDNFLVTPLQITLSGAGFRNVAREFESTTGLALNSGVDSARFYDTPGDDDFITSPTVARMNTGGITRVAKYFESVFAHAINGGNDNAFLYGSEAADFFHNYRDRSEFSGSGSYVTVFGFEQTIGFGQGGIDFAVFHEVGNADYALGQDQFLRLRRGNGMVSRVNGFDTQHDRATLEVALTDNPFYDVNQKSIDYTFETLPLFFD